jgi:negative regulator of sigma E activity
MSTAITSAVISSDLKADPDQIWTAEALPNSTTKLSSAFKLGQTLGGVEVKVVCATAGTLTAALNVEVQTSATSGGTYATQGQQTTALGAIVVGQELGRFILPREVEGELYTKVALITTDTEAAMAVDAYLVFVS